MSKTIKLQDGEVEFWKACVVASVRRGAENTIEDADDSVIALRERMSITTDVHGGVYVSRCSKCSSLFTSTSPMKMKGCPICGDGKT